MQDIKAVLDKAVAALSRVPGIRSIVLGGSRARGTHTSSSDIDIGLYYDHRSLDLDALAAAARELDDEHRQHLIAPPGEWGPWVNGGGWLVVDGSHVDLILRDLQRVEEVIADCQSGAVSPHYQTGHPHAYLNVMYMGELAVCKLLWERDRRTAAVKQTAERYPDELQKALIRLFSFEMEFSLWLAEASVDSDDSYYVTAHLVRSVSALNQVLFALNREYCLNEKRAVRMIDRFAVHPINYKHRIDAVFAAAGTDHQTACALLRQLVGEANALLTAEQTEHVTATLDTLSNSRGMSE